MTSCSNLLRHAFGRASYFLPVFPLHRLSFLILRIFPQASTMKYDRPQFLHKREMFFCCDSHSCAAEWSHRIRGTFQGLPNDVCGEASGRPAILEGELLGEIGNARERGAGCPGIAASSMSPLYELGRAVGRRRGCGVVVLESRFRNRNGKCGTPKMMGALSDRYSRPAAPKRRAGSLEGSTKDAARMAGPGRICLRRLTSRSPFVLL
jgi:hypothetical protein